MRVIIDVRLLAKGGYSGIEEYTRNLVSSILEQDKENIHTLFYNGLRKEALPHAWSAHPGVHVVARNIPNKLFDASSRLFALPKIENLCGGGDVVVSPHFNVVSTTLPHVVTFHDLSFLHHPNFFPWRKRMWHWMQDYKRTAVRAAHIIAISEFTKHDLVTLLRIPEEKISAI